MTKKTSKRLGLPRIEPTRNHKAEAVQTPENLDGIIVVEQRRTRGPYYRLGAEHAGQGPSREKPKTAVPGPGVKCG